MLADVSRKRNRNPNLNLNPAIAASGTLPIGPFPLDRGKSRLALNRDEERKSRSDSSHRIATHSTFSPSFPFVPLA